MDLNKAKQIFDVKNNYNADKIKKKYYKLCLEWHPDKNKSKNAKEKFQEITEAYKLLKSSQPSTFHKSLTTMIAERLIRLTTREEIDEQIIGLLIDSISDNYGKVTMKLLELIDTDILIKLYEISLKHNNLLFQNIQQKLALSIKNKLQNDKILMLNVSIDNMLDGVIYKILFDDKIYDIPLWHDEIIFDIKEYTLRIKCVPIYDDYISITKENDIIINISTTLNRLLENNNIQFSIGTHNFEYKCENIKVKREQQLIMNKKGLPKINLKNVYDNTDKSDIIINLNISDI